MKKGFRPGLRGLRDVQLPDVFPHPERRPDEIGLKRPTGRLIASFELGPKGRSDGKCLRHLRCAPLGS